MALCPFATQKPVSAHGGPIGTILGVVIHVTAGEGDPYNEFANPNNQVSSHFGIGNGQGGMADGLIEQYVDTADESWAQAAGNANYISVETEGEPTDPLTTAQILSFGKLYAWLNQTYGIPLVITDIPGTVGFITHGDGGVAWGDHIDCPGPVRTTQRTAILFIAYLILNPPVEYEEESMSLAVLQNGEVAVSCVGAGNRANHLLVFTLNATDPEEPNFNVIDVTDGIGTADPYTVTSA